MNITLIGMPGSGKSYIGKMLADKLGYTLVELDSVLEQKYGLPVQKIIEKIGERAFLETQANDVIAHSINKDTMVISPGGSIIYTQRAMEHLKHNSKIVYLKTSLSTIQKRIAEVPRSIIGLQNKTLTEVYSERAALYETWALVTVDSEQDSEKVVHDILEAL